MPIYLVLVYFIVWPTWWLIKTLILYFSVVVALTVATRTYKLIWRRNHRRPVRGSDAVLITGATSGIGLALAKHLFALGYSVIVGYYDSCELGYSELKQLASGATNKYQLQVQKMLFVELDVRQQDSIERASKECTCLLEEHKLKLYALVNNAGLGSLQPLAWLQRKTIRNIIETNLLGSLLMIREFLPPLVESRGRILNVSSGLALVPGATYATYGITKSSLLYLTRCLNMELKGQFGIQSVSVIPHNLIKNTSICAQNVKNNKAAWEELKEIERKLYENEFNQHCQLAKSLEEATKKHAKLINDFNVIKKRSAQTGKQKEKQIVWWQVVLKEFRDFFERLQGENAALTLEDSGALECFVDALQLVDPPEHIFAGDKIYNLLVGSLLLSVPASCTGLLGAYVAPSLYR